ncbi:MAG: DNA polymerase III subunit delta' [Pseudomonadota bacterium]
MSDEIPEPDALPGAPHPRMVETVFGQSNAEQTFLETYAAGRVHHAWLISGPRGVGKATLAWRIARFLLAEPPKDGGLFGETPAPATLDTDQEHPVVRRTRALSEPRLFLLRRGWDDKTKRLRAEITVDETRKLHGFFAMSAPDGGRRVVIVDAADEMNVSAANAILKLLEEPPANATLLLVCHRPARLLPTIRSRCRELRCAPLLPQDVADALAQAGMDQTDAALAELAGGSAGVALSLAAEDGARLYADIMDLVATAPAMDRNRATKLADSAAGRGKEARRDLILYLLDTHLARLAKAGTGAPPAIDAAPGETAHLLRLSPDPSAARRWAALQQELSDRAGHGLAVNLDPSSLILDMVLSINESAAAILSRH